MNPSSKRPSCTPTIPVWLVASTRPSGSTTSRNRMSVERCCTSSATKLSSFGKSWLARATAAGALRASRTAVAWMSPAWSVSSAIWR
jgi:hypothetical protein